jgi:hypothetical protein
VVSLLCCSSHAKSTRPLACKPHSKCVSSSFCMHALSDDISLVLSVWEVSNSSVTTKLPLFGLRGCVVLVFLSGQGSSARIAGVGNHHNCRSFANQKPLVGHSIQAEHGFEFRSEEPCVNEDHGHHAVTDRRTYSTRILGVPRCCILLPAREAARASLR